MGWKRYLALIYAWLAVKLGAYLESSSRYAFSFPAQRMRRLTTLNRQIHKSPTGEYHGFVRVDGEGETAINKSKLQFIMLVHHDHCIYTK